MSVATKVDLARALNLATDETAGAVVAMIVGEAVSKGLDLSRDALEIEDDCPEPERVVWKAVDSWLWETGQHRLQNTWALNVDYERDLAPVVKALWD